MFISRCLASVGRVGRTAATVPSVRSLSTKPQQSSSEIIDYSVATPDDAEEMMDFLEKNHYPHVPTMSFLKVDYKEIAEAGLETAREQMAHDMSLLVRDVTTGEVVGASILYEMKGQPIDYFKALSDRWTNHPSFPHWRILYDLHKDLDMRQIYKDPVLLHGRTYCAKKEYQALGIGTGINIASGKQVMKRYKNTNSVYIFGEGIGAYSNKIMERMGYEFHRRINYDSYEINGAYPFRQLAEKTPHKFSTVGAWRIK